MDFNPSDATPPQEARRTGQPARHFGMMPQRGVAPEPRHSRASSVSSMESDSSGFEDPVEDVPNASPFAAPRDAWGSTLATVDDDDAGVGIARTSGHYGAEDALALAGLTAPAQPTHAYPRTETMRIAGVEVQVVRNVISTDTTSAPGPAGPLVEHFQPRPPVEPRATSPPPKPHAAAFTAQGNEMRTAVAPLFEQLPSSSVNLAGVAGIVEGVRPEHERRQASQQRRHGASPPPSPDVVDDVDFASAYRRAVESLARLNEGLP